MNKKISPCRSRLSASIARWGFAALMMTGGVAPEAHAQDAAAIEGETVTFEIEKPLTHYGVHVSRGIRYSVRTQNETATAGEDYETVIGKVAFGIGAQYAYVSVRTYSDDVDEDPGETFKLILTDPQIMSGTKTRMQWTSTSLIPAQITLTGEIKEPQ